MKVKIKPRIRQDAIEEIEGIKITTNMYGNLDH